MKPLIVIQQISCSNQLPKTSDLEKWTLAALGPDCGALEVTLRLVDEEEMTTLNETYRGKKGPTNVLSFPCEEELLDEEVQLLGDIVVCAPVMEKEAIALDIPLSDHWAHIIVHGVLHLLGMDHEQEEDAALMETREIEILSTLGVKNPYEEAA